MRITWREVRARAATFSREWAGEGYEKGQTQLFYKDFFDIFNVPVRKFARFEEPVQRLGNRRGFVDLFWKGVLLVEQKSVGRNLQRAKEQALDYFPSLSNDELPRYVLVSDFQTFELHDLDENEITSFTLEELHKNVEKFGFILGLRKRSFKDQDPVNIRASELIGRLHDRLRVTGYLGHDLEQFLVRIVFCLFGDDAGIFESRDVFHDLIESKTREDGGNVGSVLAELFQTLNTPIENRSSTLDPDLGAFPYINGGLFADRLLIPTFNSEMRSLLLKACGFDWSEISPAIFGSLFQSVMNPTERRASGAHYTTEQNILKVIEPLFLEQFRSEFERLKLRRDSRKKNDLRAFQQKLGTLKFFDPACGCGNFLIISYRELRQLEIEIIKELRIGSNEGQQELDATELSRINVNQFYGIELSEFPALIAETALWMMDHLMNVRLSLEFGQTYVRIPLTASPHICQGDALELDWSSVLDARECTFVLGNPPFAGAKVQSANQRAQIRRLAGLGGSGGTLDFVAGWFLKVSRYVENGNARIAFVATNSITQGEQVGQLWPTIFDRGLEISFAHRTFAWGSDARGVAHVHVVIIGLSKSQDVPSQKQLFSYQNITETPHLSLHSVLSPYLFDAGGLQDPHLCVKEASSPINGLPRLVIGSKPIDDGNYIFSEDAKQAFLSTEPNAISLFRPYIGSEEFINGGMRWILVLDGESPSTLRALPQVMERIQNVRVFREASSSESTRALGTTPTKFHVTVLPNVPYLVIPEVSSEKRSYVPIGWLEPPTVPSSLVRIIENADTGLFALLTSTMHMSWMRFIGGRLKSDYRYSIGLVYNTFPVVPNLEEHLIGLRPLGQAILAARSNFPHETMANLYDDNLMPSDLKRAHHAVDDAVDRLYRRGRFNSDQERVEHLMKMYESSHRVSQPRRVSSVRRTRA